jgi:hypothetical protein
VIRFPNDLAHGQVEAMLIFEAQAVIVTESFLVKVTEWVRGFDVLLRTVVCSVVVWSEHWKLPIP